MNSLTPHHRVRLAKPELMIGASCDEQFGVRTALDDLTIREDADAIEVGDRTARVLGRYTNGAATFHDFEDIATGPCPGGSCIFMGDIGREDSTGAYPTAFQVYRIPEPNLALVQTTGNIAGDSFLFQSPPNEVADVEALLVHPATSNVYVVTKNRAAQLSKVYKLPNPLPPREAPSPR